MRSDILQQVNAAYIDELYERYRSDPGSVEEDWRSFFAGFDAAATSGTPGSAARSAQHNGSDPAPAATQTTQATPERTIGIFDLVHSYRELGHLIANLNPLGDNPTQHPLLELSQFGFADNDLDRQLRGVNFGGSDDTDLRGLVGMLRDTYSRTLGVEYMHIPEIEQREWLQARIEPNLNEPELDAKQRKRLLVELLTTNGLERFLNTKYLAQKRFSIEGAESLIPMLNTTIEEAGEFGAEEIVMGMPHRGRLNVMANVLGKPYDMVFAEFEGSFLPTNVQGDGDVKYHLGYSREYVTGNGRKVHVSLLYNPSHLEAIDPVVTGIVRAKQDYLLDTERTRVVPILIHGDAAFTGQGMVMETLALSELDAYTNGGTIHIIVDNQVGFTASPEDTRSTHYPSDLAKFINAPVFHVNTDDPEAAVQAARMAVGFRETFKEDVIIHLVCYRRHGHNELDDPRFTQPLMYKKIDAMRPVHELYAERLISGGVTTPTEVEEMESQIRRNFETALDYARDTMPKQKVFAFGGAWEGMGWAGKDWSAHTEVPRATLERILKACTTLPPTFNGHRTVKRLLDARGAMLDGDGATDWACGEMLAFGTLLLEGTNVRLSGQDSQRGTFSHRHSVLHDSETDELHVPLNHIGSEQGKFTVINSLLSEAGVLGFEYGYSSADPRNLVLWEAQYGDFANGAQVIIDQFISSAESKWQRQSGVVLLLPHGYEGQGPEHSSARLERYLQLCAEDNIQVCYPTTPAQYFHVLRRQILRRFRKPLVLMTPKSMLRNKLVVSPASEYSDHGFRSVIDETQDIDKSKVRRIVLCTGKIYYALLNGRNERVIDNIALVRVEQLYPFPEEEIKEVLATYPDDARIVWCQEEPENMGAYHSVWPRLRQILGRKRSIRYVGREAAASPAIGSYKIHDEENAQIMNTALRKPRKKSASGDQGDQDNGD